MLVRLEDSRDRSTECRRTRDPRIANCSGFYGDRIVGRPRDGRRRADRRAHRRLVGRAHHADPGQGQGCATPTAATPRPSSPKSSDVLGRLPRPRHQGRAATPAGSTRPGARRPSRPSPPRPGSTCTVAYVEGDDIVARLDEARAAGSRPRQPRHRREARRARRRADHGQRLPRRLGHRRGPRRVAPTSSITGRVTDAAVIVGPGRVALRLGPHATGTSWPARSSPATSSSAEPSAPAATTPSSRRSPASSTSGFPIAEIAADGSFVDHQAPRHRRRWSRSARSPRSCSTRSRASSTSTPTRPCA